MNLFNYKHKDKDIKRDYETPNIKRSQFTHPKSEDVKDTIKKETEKIDNKIDKLLEANEYLKNNLKNELASTEMRNVSSFFDKAFINQLDKFHHFMSTFMPGIPPYYKIEDDGSVTVQTQAYIDAKDYLLNEFGFSGENAIGECDFNGNLNIERMHFANDYSVTANGNIYKGKNLIFDLNKPKSIKLDFIDFATGIIGFKSGVRIRLDRFNKDKIEKFFIDENPYISKGNPNRRVVFSSVDDMIAKVKKDIPKKHLDEFIKDIKDNGAVSLDDLNDINGEDMIPKIRSVLTDSRTYPEGFQYCNTSHINYLWLMFLLIVGGGSARRHPLPQDGTVCGYFRKPHRKSIGFVGSDAGGACGDKSYRTGHSKAYSSHNPQGIKVSLIQMVYSFLSPFYDINIKSLEFKIKVSKWKVGVRLTPAFCIGGLIEHAICKLQEWVSEEIRSTQGCNSQYIIPKLKDDGEGLVLDGIEELNSNSRNRNDMDIYYRRNFAILWNYTHYHSKYKDYSEKDRYKEMISLYSTLKMSSLMPMTIQSIKEMEENNYQIMYSDIVIDGKTGKASEDFDYNNSYRMKIQPSSLVKMFANNVTSDTDTDVDPSNVNKIIQLGLYASYNCDLIDDLDLFVPDYTNSTFEPQFADRGY